MSAAHLRPEWRYLRLATNEAGKFKPLHKNNGDGLTADEIEEWAEAGKPYGVRTGTPSGVVVIDIDPRNLPDGATVKSEYKRLRLPPTYRVRTPSGGLHAYFHAPEDVLEATGRSHQFGRGIDFVGNWPYVVAAGVERFDGTYTPLNERPVADLPEPLCEIVRERVNRASSTPVVEEASKVANPHPSVVALGQELVQQAIADLDALADLPDGARHDLGRGDMEGWDTGVFTVAQRLVGIAMHAETDYTLEQAEEDFLSHAPEAEGTYKPEHKWEQALARPFPFLRPNPDQMFSVVTEAEVEGVSGNYPARWSDDEKWLLPGILPAKAYGILSGPLGSGKSSVAGFVATELSNKGIRIRYLVQDESAKAARRRLELSNAKMENLDVRDRVPDLSTPEQAGRYAESCAKDGVDLVIIDLLESANPGYKAAEPEAVKRWATTLVTEFCKKRGVGVLGLWHWNSKGDARSASGRLQGAGAIAGPSEFMWAVAKKRDNSEQVWTVERRRDTTGFNFLMEGVRHQIGSFQHPFTGMPVDEEVYVVRHKADTNRSAFDVEREDAREFAKGRETKPKAADLITPEMLQRYLSRGPRKMADIVDFTYLVAGVKWTRDTVRSLLGKAGAWQTDRDGVSSERGKFWYYDEMGPIDEPLPEEPPEDMFDESEDMDDVDINDGS